MAYERRDNSGTLNRNDRKQQPNHPDHRGQAIIDGVEYWIGAWIKDGPHGKFFSMSFTKKDAQQPQQSRPQQHTTSNDTFDDDIPF
jgi:hypothetical protein